MPLSRKPAQHASGTAAHRLPRTPRDRETRFANGAIAIAGLDLAKGLQPRATLRRLVGFKGLLAGDERSRNKTFLSLFASACGAVTLLPRRGTAGRHHARRDARPFDSAKHVESRVRITRE